MSLELVPNGDLVFKGPFTAVSTTTLKLNNSGNERLAYKIKTTAPKRYCVKPNSGFLEPHANAGIQVMLQPQAAGQADDRTKHKFMVQWVAVPSSYTDDVDNFWKQDTKSMNVQDSKLKCVFLDDQPAAVVPDSSTKPQKSDAPAPRVTEPTSSIENRPPLQAQPQASSASSSLGQSRSSPVTARISNIQADNPSRSQDAGEDTNKARLKQEIDRLKEENDQLRERVKQQENLRQRVGANDQSGSTSTNSTGPSKTSQQQGLLVLGVPFNEQLILVAFVVALLFGFSLGYFLFSCGN